MSIVINESFTVNAPVERVWRFLTSPQEVVRCLPGAELTEVLGEREYAGRVKVKVGPVTAAYAGKATLTEVADALHQMTLVGEGRETGGSGSAKMTMRGSVVASAGGGSDINVNATIDIAGKVMQFGRGLVESVSQQLFKQFVEQARAHLETPVAEQGASSEERVPMPPPASPTRELRLVPLLLGAIQAWFRRFFR